VRLADTGLASQGRAYIAGVGGHAGGSRLARGHHAQDVVSHAAGTQGGEKGLGVLHQAVRLRAQAPVGADYVGLSGLAQTHTGPLAPAGHDVVDPMRIDSNDQGAEKLEIVGLLHVLDG